MAMTELITQEGYIATDWGLLPGEQAYKHDGEIYIGHIPIAMITPTSMPGYQLQHFSKMGVE